MTVCAEYRDVDVLVVRRCWCEVACLVKFRIIWDVLLWHESEQLAAEKQRTERVPKRILTEEEMSALSDRLMQVTKGMTVTVRYFKEDTAHPEVPAVGNYITLTGKADRIDPVFRTLQVGDTVVPFEDLVELSGEGIIDIDAYLGIGKE